MQQTGKIKIAERRRRQVHLSAQPNRHPSHPLAVAFPVRSLRVNGGRQAMHQPEQRIRHLSEHAPSPLLVNENMANHVHDFDVGRMELMTRMKAQSRHPDALRSADADQSGTDGSCFARAKTKQVSSQELPFDARSLLQEPLSKLPAPAGSQRSGLSVERGRHIGTFESPAQRPEKGQPVERQSLQPFPTYGRLAKI